MIHEIDRRSEDPTGAPTSSASRAHKSQCIIDRSLQCGSCNVQQTEKTHVCLHGVDLGRIISNYDRSQLSEGPHGCRRLPARINLRLGYTNCSLNPLSAPESGAKRIG